MCGQSLRKLSMGNLTLNIFFVEYCFLSNENVFLRKNMPHENVG